jgi:hypothetical protein
MVEQKDGMLPSKIFADPNYAPRIAEVVYDDGKYEVVDEIVIRSASKEKPLGGLPPLKLLSLPGLTPLKGELLEESLTPELIRIEPKGEGVDPEGIAVAKDGTFWIAEEYGPSLLHLDQKGRVITRLYPGEGLPIWVREMQPNRGFEGIAILPGEKNDQGAGDLIVAMQSARVSKEGGALPFVDLLRFDRDGVYLGHYRWPLPVQNAADYGDVKIGDLWGLSSTSALAVRTFRSSVTIEQIDGLKHFSANTKEAKEEIINVRSHTVVNLSGLGWKKDKTEGLALLPDGKTILVGNDDDFGVKGKLKLKADETVLRADGLLHSLGPVTIQVKLKKSSVGPEIWFIELDKNLLG